MSPAVAKSASVLSPSPRAAASEPLWGEELPPPAERTLEAEQSAAALADEDSAPPILPSRIEEDQAETILKRAGSLVFYLRVLTTLAVLYTLYVAQAIFIPIFMAVVLYLLLRPPVRWMARKRIPEFVGAGICLVVLGIAAASAVVPLIGPARNWVTHLPQHIDKVGEKLQFLKVPLGQLKELQARVSEIASGGKSSTLFKVMVQQPDLTGGTVVLSATGSMLGTAFVVLVLTFFLLTTGDDLLNNVLSILPTFREKRKVVELVQDVQRGVSTYLGTITLINGALGVVIALAMWLLGMPTPALWGLLVAVFNYIPFVGQGVAGLIVGLVALLTFESVGFAALVLGVFYGIVAIEGHLITPAILGRHMSLNPVVVLLFLMFGGWMWGVAGAALAVPVLAILKIAFDRFDCTRPVGTLLGGYHGIVPAATATAV